VALPLGISRAAPFIFSLGEDAILLSRVSQILVG
jgi:hypothetical protein